MDSPLQGNDCEQRATGIPGVPGLRPGYRDIARLRGNDGECQGDDGKGVAGITAERQGGAEAVG